VLGQKKGPPSSPDKDHGDSELEEGSGRSPYIGVCFFQKASPKDRTGQIPTKIANYGKLLKYVVEVTMLSR
jgi:hypothetical protein